MSVLRSICNLHTQQKLCLTMKPLCCPGWISAHYSTEPPATTAEEPFVPAPKILPGRKYVYEPPYLDLLQPKYPTHKLLNLKLKGYDFAVLERLQKLIHKYLNNMDIDVSDAYALRAESWRVQRFAPNSAQSVAEFQLKEYQRVLQLSGVPSIKLGIILELVQTVTPSGVTCSIAEHTEEDEKMKYIPDMEIKALQEQLEELGGPSKLALQREKEALFRR